MMLTAPNNTSAKARLMQAVRRRDSGKSVMTRSIRFRQIDDDGVGIEEERHHREEEHGVAQIDDAAQNRAEMTEKAERRHGVEDARGRPALQESEHHGRTGHG